MAEVSYDDFLPHVLPYVPNCSEPQAINAIRNACIDFCKDTQFLQQDLDPISVQALENTYTPDVPSGYVLGRILSLYWSNYLIRRKSQAELEKLLGFNWQSLSGSPVYFTQFDPDNFVVAYRPEEDLSDGFTGRISIVPIRTSSRVDSLLLERYAEDIANGALARLLRTPNEAYTDFQKAIEYEQKFRVSKQNAIGYVKGGMNYAPLRVHMKRRV